LYVEGVHATQFLEHLVVGCLPGELIPVGTHLVADDSEYHARQHDDEHFTLKGDVGLH